MRSIKKLSIATAAIFAFAGVVVAAGCAETAGEAGPTEDAATGESQQALDIFCNATTIGADRTFSTPPGVCQSNTATSLGDTYAEPLCGPYVVEYTYKPLELAAGWDHEAGSKNECEALRASLTVYTFNGAWVTNGTAKFHGAWCDPSGGGFCPVTCRAVLDSGSSIPSAGAGTKWRAAATAYAQNCGGSSCYTDFKRVAVSDSGQCIAE